MRGIKNLLQRNFSNSVALLAGSTALAQAIGILSLPLLTRIYSPSDFGVLAVFAAVLAIVTVISCLRYEIAIPLPESDSKAANIVVVAAICLVAMTAFSAVMVTAFSRQAASLVSVPELSRYLWLLPVAVLASGSYAILQFWATRRQAFAYIARTRLEQSVGGVGAQLLFGWGGAGALGLIVGQIISNGAGVFGLARRFRTDHALHEAINFKQAKTVAGEYDRFPKYSTFEGLANAAGVQMPVIIVASLAASAEVGCLMLALKILQAPISMIGNAISQVYFSRAAQAHRKGELGKATSDTIARIGSVGVGPIVFGGIVAPALTAAVFGQDWARTGELLAWMTPWFVLAMLVSPVSMSLHVTGNQRVALILQLIGLVGRVGTVLGAAAFIDVRYVSEAFALSGAFFYAGYLAVICRLSRISAKQLFVALNSTFLNSAIWGAAAILALVVNRPLM